MLVTTYSEARKTFAAMLDRARADGAVLIKRADGTLFRLSPERSPLSPFDGVETTVQLPPGALASALAQAKEDAASRLTGNPDG